MAHSTFQSYTDLVFFTLNLINVLNSSALKETRQTLVLYIDKTYILIWLSLECVITKCAVDLDSTEVIKRFLCSTHNRPRGYTNARICVLRIRVSCAFPMHCTHVRFKLL